MNVDTVLTAFNTAGADYLLIGGMCFLLRHQPVLTFDIDLWVKDAPENLGRCEAALRALDAQWGPDERSWDTVRHLPAGWLQRQPIFCLTSPHGAIDIFRRVRGLPDWDAVRARAIRDRTAAGILFISISDSDLLACQLALDNADRKPERIAYLQRLLDTPA